MSGKKLLQSKRCGAVMALMLLVIVILLATGVGLLGLGLRSRILAIRDASEITARCAADAGLTMALFEMNEKLKIEPWDDSTLPQTTDEALPNCNATFSYTVTGDVDTGYTIESAGKSNQSEKTVGASLQLEAPLQYAIFTETGFRLHAGSVIDWYNFDADDPTFQLGTNSTAARAIDLQMGVNISGGVVVGPGGDPNVVINRKPGVVIAGGTSALAERQELPSVTVPQWLRESPSKGTIKGGAIITSSGKCDKITIAINETVTIDGPVTLYVEGSVDIGNGARLQIVDANTNPDAFLTLYVKGNLTSGNAGTINNLTRDPKKLKIYGLDTCIKIDLAATGRLYGAIYAPKASVVMHNAVEVYGSIEANYFEQQVQANYHYDAELREGSIGDEAVSFVVKQWHE